MSLADIFSRVCDQVPDRLVELAQDIAEDGMNPHFFRELIARLKASVDAAGLCSLQAFIAAQEEVRDLLEHDGREHRRYFARIPEKGSKTLAPHMEGCVEDLARNCY